MTGPPPPASPEADRAPSPPPLAFAYHRSIGPPTGVLLALALIETMTVHLAASAYWGRAVAIVLGLVDVAVLVMLVRLLRSLRRFPVTLGDDVLLLRTGHRPAVPVALANIAGLRERWSRADVKARTTLNMALVAWPNIMLDLKRPIARGRRRITAVAHCVDDPAALREALLARLPAAGG